MNIYRQLEALPKFKRAVLSMGSFDGVHLGHQHITKQLIQLAEARDGETVLLTFDPHPRIVLAQKKGEQSSPYSLIILILTLPCQNLLSLTNYLLNIKKILVN